MLRAHKWSIKQPLLCPNIVGGVAGWSGGALSLSPPVVFWRGLAGWSGGAFSLSPVVFWQGRSAS